MTTRRKKLKREWRNNLNKVELHSNIKSRFTKMSIEALIQLKNTNNKR